MILGRSRILWLALIAAVLNVAVVVFSVPLNEIQIGALNILALTALGVIANESDPTTVGTLALTMKAPRR
jgi:uncharacterized membrane protein